MTDNICRKKYTILTLVDFVLVCVYARLCDFSTVGQTSPHWLQPPRHCIYFDFQQYMCVCWFALWRCMFEMCRLPDSDMAATNFKFAKLWLTRVLQLLNSGLAAATLWFTRVWQLPNSGKCQTRVLVMKSFLRWCYCVILATFHFVLCWFCLVLFCSILSKRFDLCCSVPVQTTHPRRAKQPCP